MKIRTRAKGTNHDLFFDKPLASVPGSLPRADDFSPFRAVIKKTDDYTNIPFHQVPTSIHPKPPPHPSGEMPLVWDSGCSSPKSLVGYSPEVIQSVGARTCIITMHSEPKTGWPPSVNGKYYIGYSSSETVFPFDG